jgi:hypothetical protein
MISDRDKATIKRLYFGQEWAVINNVIEELHKEIQDQSKLADNEWETLRNTVLDEGGLRVLRRLQQKIFDLASQAND